MSIDGEFVICKIKDCYHNKKQFFDLICGHCKHYIEREELMFCPECRLIFKLIGNPTNFKERTDKNANTPL